ncbi:hypothetical protein L3X38_036837 [Prunus dulcis]|uniref:Uncharacterized protein n=1 Tax=Prunus dulcis TaxID=3755 RepID=A0AAD4V1Y9_PRUDU|nr:hypothetical protein L3X38_036837 [Prunus dulcis]
MVNANFPRPDQPRPRLDLGGSTKAAAERRTIEILTDPKARGKAKMYPEVAKVLRTKVSTKEEPPKAIVLCRRCQCQVTLEVVSPKPKELTKEPTRGLIKEPTKDQVQVGRSRSFERSRITSLAENYGLHSPRGRMEVRPNKRPLHEYQDRYERPRYQPKMRNQHAPLRRGNKNTSRTGEWVSRDNSPGRANQDDGNKLLEVGKARVASAKAKPPVAKAPVMTKVA